MLKLEALLRRHWSHCFVDSSFKLNMCDRDLTYRWAEWMYPHIIILEHTDVSSSKHWAQIKQAVRHSFNGADLMWPISKQSERHRTDVLTNKHQSLSSVCVWVSERWLEITAACVCRGPYCGFGFVYELSGLYVVWICYFIIYLQFMSMCVFPANYSSVWTTVCLHLWDWSKCPCVITSLCVCGPDFLP